VDTSLEIQLLLPFVCERAALDIHVQGRDGGVANTYIKGLARQPVSRKAHGDSELLISHLKEKDTLNFNSWLTSVSPPQAVRTYMSMEKYNFYIP